MRRKAAAFVLVFLSALPSYAQTLFQGRIDVTVLDSQNRAIPGVLVEISGAAAHSQTTDSTGEVHFLNLPSGRYAVAASLSGFSPYSSDNIEVAAGRSVPLKIGLNVSGVTEAVQVRAEPLVVDPGRQTITTSISGMLAYRQ